MENSTVNKKRFSPFESKRTRAQRERIDALMTEVDSLQKRLTVIDNAAAAALKAPSGLFSKNALLWSFLTLFIWAAIPIAIQSLFHVKLPLEFLGSLALAIGAALQVTAKRPSRWSPMLADWGWTLVFAGSAALTIRTTAWAQ